MKDVLFEMTRKRLGMTTVVDESGRLLGMISDGDLRRGMERHGYAFLERPANECMSLAPVDIDRRALATGAYCPIWRSRAWFARARRSRRVLGGTRRPDPGRSITGARHPP